MMISYAKIVFLVSFFHVTSGSYDISERILFPNLPNAAPRSENKVCREESQTYIANLNNMTLWAHQIWDATSKSTSGVLKGSVFHFGSWDECLSTEGPFRTQYCFATMVASIPDDHTPKDQLSLNFDPMSNVLKKIYKTGDVSKQTRNAVNIGWCVPASCTHLDLEQSLNQYLEKVDHPFHDHNVTYSSSVNQNTCQRKNEIEIIDSVDIGFCILTAVLILMVLIGTIYDVRTLKEFDEKEKKKTGLLHNIVISFSARKSFIELPRADENNSSLKVLYGIRTFAIMMIIMDHRFGTYISGPMENFDYIEKEYRSVSAWFIFHGDLFVDTFFILSGILVAYGLLNQLNKKYVHPAFIILIRYVRLTPLYAFVIFFWSSMFAHIGSGPFWRFVIPAEVADCRKNWWANLLYISNYVDDDHMCMTHSWYLPCDFHYFIIAIFVILLINKNKKLGFGLLSGLLLLSIVIPFLLTVIHLRPALLHFYPVFLVAPKVDTDFQLTYTKSHTRASSYFTGMFLGYFYYKYKDSDFKLSKLKSHVITLVSIFLLFLGMSSGAVFYNPYHEYNVIEAAAYAALHRCAWSLGSVGLILAASNGHATAIYNFLSWSPFIPLSKLVYGAYLTHMLFQLRGVAIATSPRHFTYFDTISMGLGDIVLAFATGFLLFIMIENPFRKIIRIILFPQRAVTKEQDVTSRNAEVSRRDTTTTTSL